MLQLMITDWVTSTIVSCNMQVTHDALWTVYVSHTRGTATLLSRVYGHDSYSYSSPCTMGDGATGMSQHTCAMRARWLVIPSARNEWSQIQSRWGPPIWLPQFLTHLPLLTS